MVCKLNCFCACKPLTSADIEYPVLPWQTQQTEQAAADVGAQAWHTKLLASELATSVTSADIEHHLGGLQAQQAEQAAADMEAQAASSTARLQREQEARGLQSRLHAADQEAQQRLQSAESLLEAGRAARREAMARTSALEHEADAAEEQAQASRRRLPGLEADKSLLLEHGCALAEIALCMDMP